MKIEFEDGDSINTVVNTGLIGYTVNFTFVNGAVSIGVPVEADRNGFVVCDANEIGAPVDGSERFIAYDDIDVLTVL